jgi:hypothetical protein
VSYQAYRSHIHIRFVCSGSITLFGTEHTFKGRLDLFANAPVCSDDPCMQAASSCAVEMVHLLSNFTRGREHRLVDYE